VSNIGKLWAGGAYGTNTGNLYIELVKTGPDVTGTLRFMDNAFGLAIYRIEGTFDQETLRIAGKPEKSAEGVELGDLEIESKLTPEGNLRGTWTTTLGNGGTFVAFPHDTAVSSQHWSRGAPVPEQIYTRNLSLGAVRLFAEDVTQLFQHIQQDFVSGRLVVTFNVRGSEVTKYAEDFLQDSQSLGPLKYLKVMIQEPEAYGINRLVVVELNAFGGNEVRVQGIQESWVIGKAEAIAALMMRNQSTLITTYKKFGLNLNQGIFVAMLVAMPSITKWTERALFAVAVFALLAALLWLHAKFIPNATVRMEVERPTLFARTWPTLLSWLVAATASLVAALMFYWLTRNAS
jgi:hypothetical protein